MKTAMGKRVSKLEKKAAHVGDDRPWDIQWEETCRKMDEWYAEFERTELADFGGDVRAWIENATLITQAKINAKLRK